MVIGAAWYRFRVFPFSVLSALRNSSSGGGQVLSKINSPDQIITLKTRAFRTADDPAAYDTELDSRYVFHDSIVDLNQTALLLIDVWENHPNDGWLERARENMTTHLRPLLQLARTNGMTILHAPHLRATAKWVQPMPGEINLDKERLTTSLALHEYLRKRGITTLLYAGYASNWCVLHRPVGIIQMHQLGYRIILVRDCTIAIETPETLDGEWVNKATINTFEHEWGETTTLTDLQQAFRSH
jgi:nicotinamidase-related amidase